MFPDGCLACGRPIAHASVKNDGASRWLSSLVAHWGEAACPCPLYVMCYDTMQTCDINYTAPINDQCCTALRVCVVTRLWAAASVGESALVGHYGQ